MPRFVVEKLPPHWLFVPSRRQLKNLIAELAADVRMIELYGTGFGRSPDRVAVGFAESRVVGGCWCFYLHLWGVRKADAGPNQDELAAAALAEIRRYIRACTAQAPADTVKPEQLHLAFRIEGDAVRSICRVSPVGKMSFPTRAWWDVP